MDNTLDKGQFWDMFKNRAVVVTDLPPGRSRDLANRANEAEGQGDASLRRRRGTQRSSISSCTILAPCQRRQS